jgi:hypothetical protein
MALVEKPSALGLAARGFELAACMMGRSSAGGDALQEDGASSLFLNERKTQSNKPPYSGLAYV